MSTDDDLLLKFGAIIRKYRQEKGFSQEDLADLTGFHRTYISLIERGKRNISLLNSLRLAKALEKPLSSLFKGL